MSVAKKTVAAAKLAPKAAKAAPAKKAPAKAAKPEVNPDEITYSGPDKTMKNAGKLVVKAGTETIMIDGERLTKQLSQLCGIGKSFAAVKDYMEKHGKSAPALAKGVESRQNPHSAKALADSRKGATAAAKPAAEKKARAPRSSRRRTWM